MYVYIYIYIYICITYVQTLTPESTANLRTKILDFGGFDSGRILSLRGGIPRPLGSLPESLSQATSVGTILVGRLGVPGGALHALSFKRARRYSRSELFPEVRSAQLRAYGQFSNVQSGRMGPAPGRFELSKDMLK